MSLDTSAHKAVGHRAGRRPWTETLCHLKPPGSSWELHRAPKQGAKGAGVQELVLLSLSPEAPGPAAIRDQQVPLFPRRNTWG